MRFVPFTDLLSQIVDNRGRSCPTSKEGIPLIATNCIKDESLYPVHEKVRHVSQETYETWFREHPEPGDIIFVTKGSPGRACLAPDPVDFCIAQDMVAVRADQKRVYPKYLFAVIRAQETLDQIKNMHVGTMIPHFKKGDFGKLLLPLPDWSVQEKIGDLYYQLSSKIELNRQVNRTLESIAQALFRSWFVDFDPVVAKAAGRHPAVLSDTASALFPGRFIESELGSIPEGWKVGTLGECAELKRGYDLPTKERESGEVPIISSSGPTGFHSKAMVKGPGVVTGRYGTIGEVYYAEGDFWPLNTTLYVRDFKEHSPRFVEALLKTVDFGQYSVSVR
jgi:type I restriction enzyme S subunit